ncbi:hypothetical protein cyc_08375 [Cyclospora cayetanensis]|uniref:RAVE complex protein Rav1 C-terminal domain-containing protein n=1 Tax=Cyclospora cayetanensis TaxID=88456 RepID=A0A1D3D665_9EIME|nr:hypothetical protein cyc_08375 [Cyclospora cayetanensis]
MRLAGIGAAVVGEASSAKTENAAAEISLLAVAKICEEGESIHAVSLLADTLVLQSSSSLAAHVFSLHALPLLLPACSGCMGDSSSSRDCDNGEGGQEIQKDLLDLLSLNPQASLSPALQQSSSFPDSAAFDSAAWRRGGHSGDLSCCFLPDGRLAILVKSESLCNNEDGGAPPPSYGRRIAVGGEVPYQSLSQERQDPDALADGVVAEQTAQMHGSCRLYSPEVLQQLLRCGYGASVRWLLLVLLRCLLAVKPQPCCGMKKQQEQQEQQQEKSRSLLGDLSFSLGEEADRPLVDDTAGMLVRGGAVSSDGSCSVCGGALAAGGGDFAAGVSVSAVCEVCRRKSGCELAQLLQQAMAAAGCLLSDLISQQQAAQYQQDLLQQRSTPLTATEQQRLMAWRRRRPKSAEVYVQWARRCLPACMQPSAATAVAAAAAAMPLDVSPSAPLSLGEGGERHDSSLGGAADDDPFDHEQQRLRSGSVSPLPCQSASSFSWPSGKSFAAATAASETPPRAAAHLPAEALLSSEDICWCLHAAAEEDFFQLVLQQSRAAHPERRLVWPILRRVAEFLQSDFSDNRWRLAAERNAFRLLTQRRPFLALAFFAIAKKLAVLLRLRVLCVPAGWKCCRILKDTQLALFLCRVGSAVYAPGAPPLGTDAASEAYYPQSQQQQSASVFSSLSPNADSGTGASFASHSRSGSSSTTPENASSAASEYSRVLLQRLLPEAAARGDIWMCFCCYWIAGYYARAFAALLPPYTGDAQQQQLPHGKPPQERKFFIPRAYFQEGMQRSQQIPAGMPSKAAPETSTSSASAGENGVYDDHCWRVSAPSLSLAFYRMCIRQALPMRRVQQKRMAWQGGASVREESLLDAFEGAKESSQRHDASSHVPMSSLCTGNNTYGSSSGSAGSLLKTTAGGNSSLNATQCHVCSGSFADPAGCAAECDMYLLSCLSLLEAYNR